MFASNQVSQNSELSICDALTLFKALPKVNAHCHLGGEIPVQTLKKYGNPEQLKKIEEAIAEMALGKDYEKCFTIFPLISQIINTHEKLREATFQTCLRLKLDNNQVVLMRTGLKSLEGQDYEKYLKTILEPIKETCGHNFKVLLLLSLKRSSSIEMATLTVDLALKYRSENIVGIDISDKSTEGDISHIMPELIRAKKNGLKIAVHMGESKEEKDQMLIIENLKPDLIDHGVNLCDEAKRWVIKEKIPVTVCLTSSLATKMHDLKKLHPWIEAYLTKEYHPIALGTDDATVFGDISLSDEFLRLSGNIDFKKVVEIANESFRYFKKLSN